MCLQHNNIKLLSKNTDSRPQHGPAGAALLLPSAAATGQQPQGQVEHAAPACPYTPKRDWGAEARYCWRRGSSQRFVPVPPKSRIPDQPSVTVSFSSLPTQPSPPKSRRPRPHPRAPASAPPPARSASATSTSLAFFRLCRDLTDNVCVEQPSIKPTNNNNTTGTVPPQGPPPRGCPATPRATASPRSRWSWSAARGRPSCPTRRATP